MQDIQFAEVNKAIKVDNDLESLFDTVGNLKQDWRTCQGAAKLLLRLINVIGQVRLWQVTKSICLQAYRSLGGSSS